MAAPTPGVSPAPIVPLDSQKHAGLGVAPSQRRRFIAARNAVPLCVSEFFYAARHYPIVFARSDDGEMRASAVTGLRRDENLFVDALGDWQQQVYVPAWIRRFPFYSAADSGPSVQEGNMVLVDETALAPSDEPFFDRSGAATARWQAMQTFLADYIAAERHTLDFAARLDRLELLEAFDAQVNPGQRGNLQVTGMYRVDEDRLNALPAKTIRKLMRQGELSRVYAHLISLENFAKLLDLSAAAE